MIRLLKPNCFLMERREAVSGNLDNHWKSVLNRLMSEAAEKGKGYCDGRDCSCPVCGFHEARAHLLLTVSLEILHVWVTCGRCGLNRGVSGGTFDFLSNRSRVFCDIDHLIREHRVLYVSARLTDDAKIKKELVPNA